MDPQASTKAMDTSTSLFGNRAGALRMVFRLLHEHMFEYLNKMGNKLICNLWYFLHNFLLYFRIVCVTVPLMNLHGFIETYLKKKCNTWSEVDHDSWTKEENFTKLIQVQSSIETALRNSYLGGFLLKFHVEITQGITHGQTSITSQAAQVCFTVSRGL